jgi:predicted metal-dependent HD superfamily phosphohydrolase
MLREDLTYAQAMREMDAHPIVVAVSARMREPWRFYHDGRHVDEIDGHLLAAEADGVTIVDGAAARAFTKWHDSVYDATAVGGRNEELSALLCEAEFPRLATKISTSRAASAIRATIGHVAPDHRSCPDAAILLDCDLAILGAPPDRFDEYDLDIRREYAHVPQDVWIVRRPAVMARFAERERIYVTQWAQDRWEAQARRNIERLLAA